MASKILQKLRENAQLRGAFQEILVYLMHKSVAPVICNMHREEGDAGGALPDEESESMEFDEQLTALVNLGRAIDVQDNDTKIGHWCTRNNESTVLGMDQWSVYWLEMQGGVTEGDVYVLHEYPVRLTLWAVGKDDNTIQKAIKVWVENHFPEWEIEKLQCVRR